MKKTTILMMATAFTVGMTAQIASANSDIDAAKLFKSKCKLCHKIDKKSMGPAVNSMNIDADVLRSTITDGRKSMPGFGKKLSPEKIEALIQFIQHNKKGEKPCN